MARLVRSHDVGGPAAWEVYLVTGDRGWLQQSYTVIRNSIEDDQQVVISPETGLARGESTFLDWREQTYPRWMQPADIYESEALVNAVYYRTYRILASMARLLGKSAQDWDTRASRIQTAINERFWVDEKGLTGSICMGACGRRSHPEPTLSARCSRFCSTFPMLQGRTGCCVRSPSWPMCSEQSSPRPRTSHRTITGPSGPSCRRTGTLPRPPRRSGTALRAGIDLPRRRPLHHEQGEPGGQIR